MTRNERYEQLAQDALRLAGRARTTLDAKDGDEVRWLAGQCKAASGDDRVVLAMTLSRYLLDVVAVSSLIHEQLADLDARWEHASRTRKKAA